MKKSQQAKPAELIELSGAQFQAYKTGQHFGMWRALNDAATNCQAAEQHVEQQLILASRALAESLPPDHALQQTIAALPKMASALGTMGKSFGAKATEHQKAGNEAMGRLAIAPGVIAWWQTPKFLGWVGYASAVVLATAVSTLVAAYAAKHSW